MKITNDNINKYKKILMLLLSVGLFLVYPVFLRAQTNLRSFGNSITLGQGLSDSNDRFSTILANYLGVYDLNGAVSGMTLVNNDFYEEEAIKDGIYQTNLLHNASDADDYVLIMFGTNDLRMIDTWNNGFNQTYADQYRDYLQLMIDSLLEMGFDNRKIFLMSDPYTQAEEAGRDSVEAITEDIALANNTLFVNVRKAIQEYGIGDYTWRSSYTDDSIHPNKEGHRVIYEVVRDGFIEQATSCPIYTFEGNIVNDIDGSGKGAVSITITGGMDELSYRWSNDATTQNIENLHEGTYSVTVTDDNLCTATALYTVENTGSVVFEQNCAANYQIPVVKQPEEYAGIVYIDPSHTGTESGTIEEPYNSWDDIEITENTAYLLKSGTTIDGFTIDVNNNYIGKYGSGDRPIIQQYLTIRGSDAVFDSLNILSYGNSQYQKVIDLANVTSVTIANSYITGLVGSYDYPYYLVRGRGEHVTFYNNIMSGAKEDGMYVGSSPYFTFVRNWMFDTNMGGVDTPYGGDGIQLEYDSYYHAYIAGNIIDRSNTMSKFCLIINAEDLTHDLVCEWNTFIAPKNGNGGAAVRWLGGANNKFNKNLIITYLEDDDSDHRIAGVASYDVSANQKEPYGVRDNHFLGYGDMFYGLSSYYDSNIGFTTEAYYQAYLSDNEIGRYGSNIDTSEFWNIHSCEGSSGGDTNINLIDETDLLTIFPNPAIDKLYISNNAILSGKYTLQLISMSGEFVMNDEVTLTQVGVTSINIYNISPGIYILKLQRNSMSFSKKVVIK